MVPATESRPLFVMPPRKVEPVIRMAGVATALILPVASIEIPILLARISPLSTIDPVTVLPTMLMPVLAVIVPALLMLPATEAGPPGEVKRVPDTLEDDLAGVADQDAGAVGGGNDAARGIDDAVRHGGAVEIDAGIVLAGADDRAAVGQAAGVSTAPPQHRRWVSRP